jgi:hypothetical protein
MIDKFDKRGEVAHRKVSIGDTNHELDDGAPIELIGDHYIEEFANRLRGKSDSNLG